MRRIAAALLASSLSMAAAQSVDADDCENVARNVKQAAEELEDAASDLDGATRRDAPDAESRVRSKASSVLGDMERLRGACGAYGPAFPVDMVLELIRGHLLAKFGTTDGTRAKLTKVEGDLRELAKTHSRVRPSDFRMTMAVAELVFQGADQ